MIRAFIGVRIEVKTVDNISAALSQLKPRIPGVRWVTKNNFHFTVKFLGEIEEARIEPIGHALEGALRPFPCFVINVKGLGVFPDLKRPRVLWVGLESKSLSALVSAVEKALEPLGFGREKRGFTPHLTVGRWRQFQGSSKQLGNDIDQWKNHEFGKSLVNEVVLFQSILKPEGAVYQPLRVLALTDRPPLS